MAYMRRIGWLVACLLVVSFGAVAGEKNPEEVGVIIERAAVLEAAKGVDKNKYPDAESVILEQALNLTYRKDGTYTQYDEQYIKILTEKARRAHSTISSYFTIPYQQIEDCKVLLIEIIKPDGQSVKIDLKKNAKLVVNNSSMSANIYDPNDKVIRVNIPGLEVGDILHSYMYDNTRQPRTRGIFADIFMFEFTTPLLKKTVRVTGDRDFPLQSIALRNPVGKSVVFEKSEQGDKIVYKWVGTNVAQAFPEPDSPELYSCTQRVLVSTAKSWKEVSDWYWRLCQKPLAETTPAMQQKVSELTANAKTPMDKIREIFRWVSQEVRYMGITTEAEAPGYEPHPVRDTFEKMHGVCRDKAALLAAMLKLAGFEAFPVIINNGPKKDPDVPQPFFNHAITAVLLDGRYVLMDSTDENTKRLLPSYLNNKSYLVATKGGEDLLTSAIVPATKNLMKIETIGTLTENGDFSGVSKLKFDGINDNAYRGYFARITPEERRRYFESQIKNVYGAAKLDDFVIRPADMQDTSKSLEVELTFSAKGIVVKGRKLEMLPLPFLGARVGMVNFVLGRAGLEKRRFPFKTDIACGVTESVRINLPKEHGKIASMPVYKNIDNPQVLWKRSLAEVGDALMGKNEFMLKVVEFAPEEYLALKSDLRQIEYNQRKMPIIALGAAQEVEKKNELSADAVVIESNVSYEITDRSSWTETRKVKKKILTYAGKKDSAEIKFDYNPAWEKVTLLEATVTAPDGKMQVISPKEINIMDQGWNGSAPRYPGGKTLVASLPGVALGSVINYTVKSECFNREFFSASESFRSFDPLVGKSVSVKYPEKFAGFSSQVFDGVKSTGIYNPLVANSSVIVEADETVAGGKVFRRWAADDVAALKREGNLPVWSSFNPTLFLSSGSWKEYAEKFSSLFSKLSANQAGAAQKARAITAEAKTAEAKVLRVRDFVATKIRTAGPEYSELPLSLLTPADKTLDDGYGHSADKAILTAAMLQALDIKYEVVPVTYYRQTSGMQTPFLDLADEEIFSAVLLRVDLGGGKVWWLNDTDQYAQPGTTPHDGYYALDLASAGFKPIGVLANNASQSELIYHIELGEGGAARITRISYAYGNKFNAAKKMFAEMTPEQLRRRHQQQLSDISYAAKADGEIKVDYKQYPGVVSFSAEVPRFAVSEDRFTYLTLPQSLRRAFGLSADERSSPLMLDGNDELRISTIISFEPKLGMPAITPKDFLWNSPDGRNRLEVNNYYYDPQLLRRPSLFIEQVGPVREILVDELKRGRRVFVIRHRKSSAPAVYSAAFYPKLLQAQNELSGYYARTLLLTSPVKNKDKELKKVVERLRNEKKAEVSQN